MSFNQDVQLMHVRLTKLAPSERHANSSLLAPSPFHFLTEAQAINELLRVACEALAAPIPNDGGNMKIATRMAKSKKAVFLNYVDDGFLMYS